MKRSSCLRTPGTNLAALSSLSPCFPFSSHPHSRQGGHSSPACFWKPAFSFRPRRSRPLQEREMLSLSFPPFSARLLVAVCLGESCAVKQTALRCERAGIRRCRRPTGCSTTLRTAPRGHLSLCPRAKSDIAIPKRDVVPGLISSSQARVAIPF